MPALYHKRLSGARNLLLVMAYLAVLGVQSSHGFYRFSSLTAMRWGRQNHHAVTVSGTADSSWALDKDAGRKMLLDRRFVPEHVVFLPVPCFSFGLTVARTHAVDMNVSWHTQGAHRGWRSRGPPFFRLC